MVIAGANLADNDLLNERVPLPDGRPPSTDNSVIMDWVCTLR